MLTTKLGVVILNFHPLKQGIEEEAPPHGKRNKTSAKGKKKEKSTQKGKDRKQMGDTGKGSKLPTLFHEPDYTSPPKITSNNSNPQNALL